MRILFVPSDNNATSGAFLSMVKLCNILIQQYNHDVLVLLHCNGDGESLLKKDGIRFTKIRSFNWFVPYNPKTVIRKAKKALCYIWMPITRLYNRIAIKQIQKLLMVEEIDIVHINTSCCYVAAEAARREMVPFVWHIREFLEEDQERCIWNNQYGYSLMTSSDKIITISKSIYDKYYRLLPGADISTVYNGIDERDFYYAHQELLKDNAVQIAIVGSINRLKGQDQAIKACEILVEEGIENFKLVIAGKEGDYVNQLRGYVANHNLDRWVDFIGPQMNVWEVYKCSDIVLMCSQAEAFGRVTVEAMMSGCLVIGANTGGTLELVADKKTGLLYQSGNPSDLAHTIKYAIQNRELMRIVAKEGQKKMLKEMTAQRNAQSINEIYENIGKKER